MKFDGVGEVLTRLKTMPQNDQFKPLEERIN